MRYEASTDGVFIWIVEADKPQVVQPHWPNGEPWATDNEAQAWAEAFIESRKNPNSENLAGPSPDSPLIPRPIIEVDENGKVLDPELTVDSLDPNGPENTPKNS